MAFRGGRGGFGAGRGRGAGGGGPVVPWAYDPDIKPHYLSTDLFPECPLPVQEHITREERIIVNRFREFRERVHNGPLYTVLTKKRGLEDPFEDAQTYSMRYKKPKRKIPKLDARPYVFEFFPAELYTTLDPTHTSDMTGAKTKAQKKRLIITSLNTNGDNFTDDDVSGDDEGGDGEGTSKKKKGGILNSLVNDEDDEVPIDDGDAEEGAEEGEEDRDTDFEDDNEGDYNGEQYFSDGEGDGDYGDGGDGDGGGDPYF